MTDLEVVVRYCEERAEGELNDGAFDAYLNVAEYCKGLIRSREDGEYERALAMAQDC